MTSQQLLQYIFGGLTNGSIYALTALGFTLIYNATGIINFAQGDFVMLGGLSAIALYRAGLPLAVACIGSLAVVMAVAMLFQYFAIRPLMVKGVLAQVIATVGASLALRAAAMMIWGRNALPLPSFSGDKPIPVLGASVNPQTVWVLGATAVIVLALQVFYKRTLTGKAVRACAVNPLAARMMGINYGRLVLLSFGVSGVISAAAGAMIAPISFMSYSSGAMLGLKGFAAAALGGLGNPLGAVCGGFILGILEGLGVGLVSSGYKDAIAFVILLLVLFVRPQGVFGGRVVQEE